MGSQIIGSPLKAHLRRSPIHLCGKPAYKSKKGACLWWTTLLYGLPPINLSMKDKLWIEHSDISRPNAGSLVFDKCSGLISIKEEKMQGHHIQQPSSCTEADTSKINNCFLPKEQRIDLWGAQALVVSPLCSPRLGHTLIPIAAIYPRAVPRVYRTVHTGHSGWVCVGELAWLLPWRGVLLHISQVTQVASHGEFLGTGCWLGCKDREGVQGWGQMSIRRYSNTPSGESSSLERYRGIEMHWKSVTVALNPLTICLFLNFQGDSFSCHL